MTKKAFFACLTLVAASSFALMNANAQSCQNNVSFGVHSTLPSDKTMESQIEVTYFTTNDPNVFISERAGISNSASFAHVDTNNFVAKLGELQKAGVASIRKNESVTSYLGATAELNLEHMFGDRDAKMVNASLSTSDPNDFSALDRKTEISITRGLPSDGEYYRVGILSWFVNINLNGGMRMVDYDGSVLMKPGETSLFKLRSDNEVSRNGSARSYIAVTMHSVGMARTASVTSRSNALASK